MFRPLPLSPSRAAADERCTPAVVDAPDDALCASLVRAAADACGASIAFLTRTDGDRTRVACIVAPATDSAVADEIRTLVDASTGAPSPYAFHLWAPITASDGDLLGHLCVVDRRLRARTAQATGVLRHLAATAARMIAMDVDVRRTQDRITLIQQATPTMLHSIDSHGVLLSVSDAWLQEMGYARDEVVGRPIFDFYTAASGEKARGTVIPRLFATGRVDDVEYDMIRKDGSLIVVLLSAVVEYDGEGRPLRTMTVNENITLRREAEIALRDGQERMARILEGTDAGTWELNIVTGETRYNARWAEIAGYALEELGKTTGATWRELMHRDDLPKAVALCVEHYEGKIDYYEMECRIRHKDGSWRWILDRGRISSRAADGSPLWMHGTRTDITSRKRAEEGLRASQNFLERVGQVAGVGGWEVNARTARLTWSDETRRLFGVAADFQPTLETALAFFTPAVRPILEKAVRDGIETGTPFDLELPFVSASGRALWTRATARVEFENDKPARLVGALQDVTRRKEMERDLAESRELLQVTLESIGDAVITTDNDSVVQWLNPVAERMTGWTKSEAVGRPLGAVFVVVDEATRVPCLDPVALCLRKAQTVAVDGHVTLISRTGAEFGIEDSASPILRADGTAHGAVLVFHDVSAQRRLNHEMSHRATHDPLTSLINRSEFEARLTRLLADVAPEGDADHALLYIDLDQFKVVNDACGHAAGDQLLKQVSAMLGRCVRTGDSLARLGGDEFGVILHHCDVESAQYVAQNICNEMDAFRFGHEGRRFRVGTSIGLVPVDHRWTSIKALMQAADASCYAAKDGGRNRVHAWRDSDQTLQARQGDMRWVSRLENALDENRFELFGQRIVPVAGESDTLQFEVLLRLREADGSLTLPLAFLAAAERFHLAARIDRWVVRHAFACLQRAEDEGLRIDLMSINLCAQSLGDRAFLRDVLQMVRDATFDVRRICFEITETAAITHMVDARGFIEGLRALGVRIALDDFGAGPSSFGYLKQLTVDFLKIDGHFIRHLLEDPLNDAAVRCFCDVARIVCVQTIADFVEHGDVRDALRDLGVDLAQGNAIHRPEPLEDLLTAAKSARLAAAA